MGDRRVATVMSALLLLSVAPFTFDDAFALDFSDRVTAEDLGVLQLAAHDLFNVDRCDGVDPSCAVDFENGKLDLSTLFVDTTDGYSPFPLETIAIGGEPRNRENIMLRTVSFDLGSTYVSLLAHGIPEDIAKSFVIATYHERLAHTYLTTFDEGFPIPAEGDATMHENLAFRTIHDFLPELILVDGEYQPIFNASMVPGLTLDSYELQQKSSKLDGEFDETFKGIDICLPPDFTICIEVDLLEADSTFATQFGLVPNFEDFLLELEDGSYDPEDEVMKKIRSLIAKGQNF